MLAFKNPTFDLLIYVYEPPGVKGHAFMAQILTLFNSVGGGRRGEIGLRLLKALKD